MSTFRLRVVSYNVLADLYADSEFSRDKLYPYCNPNYLAMEYRAPVLMKELLGNILQIISSRLRYFTFEISCFNCVKILFRLSCGNNLSTRSRFVIVSKKS